MENEKNKSKDSSIAIIILTILVIALGGYIGYDKFLSKDNASITEENLKSETDKNEVENIKENEEEVEKSDYVKTRICTGIYSGTAALTEDVLTGEYGKGTLTIELKADGTYELKKENMNGGSGAYTIIDNTLLLKTAPHTCGPGMDCSAKYSEYLNISEDCSSISWGYGSYFFDPSFTLNKQN